MIQSVQIYCILVIEVGCIFRRSSLTIQKYNKSFPWMDGSRVERIVIKEILPDNDVAVVSLDSHDPGDGIGAKVGIGSHELTDLFLEFAHARVARNSKQMGVTDLPMVTIGRHIRALIIVSPRSKLQEDVNFHR